MNELDEGHRAFSSFRVLNGESNDGEREQLFRNMAKLFSYVSDRCDDDQVAQYDEVLCQLASLVEVEARAHVAQLLAPLERAPGTVVLRLANDLIEVARPLLEFSGVLSDDDLIDIVVNRSEAHRHAIANRFSVPERVGAALVEHGGSGSVVDLVRNPNAEIRGEMMTRLVERATTDSKIAADLRNRADIDWKSVRSRIDDAAETVMESLEARNTPVDPVAAGTVNAVVYARMRNKAGFSAKEWKTAYNQVKALADRRQLDMRALARFARFSYGHHAAATLSVMLRVSPEVVVKWLASQDYAAATVALKAAGADVDLFGQVMGVLPWRDLPSEADREHVRVRFEALNRQEAAEIFETWRAHAFRRREARDTVQASA